MLYCTLLYCTRLYYASIFSTCWSAFGSQGSAGVYPCCQGVRGGATLERTPAYRRAYCTIVPESSQYFQCSCRCAGEGKVRCGRYSGLLAPLLHAISAAITGGGSPLPFLTQRHLLSLESYWKCLCSILRCPSLILLPCLSTPPPPTLSFLFADSASFSLNPLCSAVFCFLCHFCSCLSAAVSCCHSSLVRACRHQRRYQTGCPLWLHKVTWNMRWEKKCQGGTS